MDEEPKTAILLTMEEARANIQGPRLCHVDDQSQARGQMVWELEARTKP